MDDPHDHDVPASIRFPRPTNTADNVIMIDGGKSRLA